MFRNITAIHCRLLQRATSGCLPTATTSSRASGPNSAPFVFLRQPSVLTHFLQQTRTIIFPQDEAKRLSVNEDMPFVHWGNRPRFRSREKFKTPRRRASKILAELTEEFVTKSKADNPDVWQVIKKVKTGDAIEVEMIEEGGVTGTKMEYWRGMVVGFDRRGMNRSVILRDVLPSGEPIQTKIPLHSPLVKKVTLLYKNWYHRGKRPVRRAKLYYTRYFNPNIYKVTGVIETPREKAEAEERAKKKTKTKTKKKKKKKKSA